jgi:hypothetical protein
MHETTDQTNNNQMKYQYNITTQVALNDCKMKPIWKKIRFLHTTHREGGFRRII